MKPNPSDAIDAYRLIRRGLVGSSTPKDVELMVGTDRVYGDLVRRIAEKAGVAKRQIHEYSPDEWTALAAHLAAGIDPKSTHVPWYPEGWKLSYARSKLKGRAPVDVAANEGQSSGHGTRG